MRRKILLIAVLLFSVVALMPLTAHAIDTKTAVCEGAGLVSGASGCTPAAGQPSVDSTLVKALNIFSAIVGIIAVIMIMVGGLRYIMSGGDSSQTNNAKNTILYAAIGLAIVALAQIIVKFVVRRFTS